jgi:predicted  nucleic acid-binding Zn-ribbon protein
MVFEKNVPGDMQTIGMEMSNRINTNTRRIRTLEQRMSAAESRIGALQEKVIDEIDRLRKSFDQISIDLKSVSENLSEIHSEILNINKNLDKTAKKAELKELENLLDLYNPIKSRFTTKDEVMRIIEDKISEKTVKQSTT